MKAVSNNRLAILPIALIVVSIIQPFLVYQFLTEREQTVTGSGTGTGFVQVCVDWLPVFDSIGQLNATEDSNFYYDVNATDQDEADGDILTYSDNTDIFEINSSTGEINFTPDNGNVGNHSITFYVQDSICNATASANAILVVENMNEAPILDYIPDQVLYEDQYFYFDVNASDADLPYGDVLEFGTNTSLFEINSSTGEISFTPVDSEADRNYSILVFVTDGHAVDTQAVNFQVIAVNDPPVLGTIGAQTALVNGTSTQAFYIDVNATDEENGTLAFYDNTGLFEINSATGEINFTPNSSDVGVYSINISVTDGNGWDWEIVSFTVTQVNNPPNITSWNPEDAYAVIYETYSQLFNITKYDPDGNTPSVQWYLDNASIGGATADSYVYTPPSGSAGTHNLSVVITDGIANDSHSWTIIVIALPPSVPSGGTTGGGAGPTECRENWRCTPWSECLRTGKQLRACIDLNSCGTFKKKPWENASCTFVAVPTCYDTVKNCHGGSCEILADCGGPCSPCPTCDDSIRNQNETGIDCGGPCPPCARSCPQTRTFAVNMETTECAEFRTPCDVPPGWKVVSECLPAQSMIILVYMILIILAVMAVLAYVIPRKMFMVVWK